jgi:hypothetical protein
MSIVNNVEAELKIEVWKEIEKKLSRINYLWKEMFVSKVFGNQMRSSLFKLSLPQDQNFYQPFFRPVKGFPVEINP